MFFYIQYYDDIVLVTMFFRKIIVHENFIETGVMRKHKSLHPGYFSILFLTTVAFHTSVLYECNIQIETSYGI